MNDTKISDEQLLADYVGGDERSFHELFRRWKPTLTRYLTPILKDPAAVDEVIQLTFIRIMNNRHRFTPGKAFKPWVYTIADRLSKDYTKTLSRRTRRTKSFTDFDNQFKRGDRPGDQLNAGEAIEISDYRLLSADEKVTHAEDTHQALGLLRALPKHLRNCVQFSVLQGMSSREAGPLFDVTHKTVQNRAKAGLNTIRIQMESGIHGEPTTVKELSECSIRDLVDTLPSDEYLSVQRVLFEETGTTEDHTVFNRFICRLVGELLPTNGATT